MPSFPRANLPAVDFDTPYAPPGLERWAEEVRAAEIRKRGKLPRVYQGPVWRSRAAFQDLFTINEDRKVSPYNLEAFSIMAFEQDLKWIQIQHENRLALIDALPDSRDKETRRCDELFRKMVREFDCEARHFPGVIYPRRKNPYEPESIKALRQRINTIPKLWKYIHFHTYIAGATQVIPTIPANVVRIRHKGLEFRRCGELGSDWNATDDHSSMSDRRMARMLSEGTVVDFEAVGEVVYEDDPVASVYTVELIEKVSLLIAVLPVDFSPYTRDIAWSSAKEWLVNTASLLRDHDEEMYRTYQASGRSAPAQKSIAPQGTTQSSSTDPFHEAPATPAASTERPAAFACSKAELLRALGKGSKSTRHLDDLVKAEKLELKLAKRPVGHHRYEANFTDSREHAEVEASIRKDRKSD
jgi:hypothetical protein